MKNLKLRKILFGSVIAAMSLATVSLSIFAISSSSSNPIEAKAALSNNGYDEGEYKYYTGSYYDSIGDSAISSGGTTLLSALCSKIVPSSAYGYSNIWTIYKTSDVYPSDYDGTDPLTGNSYPTTKTASGYRGKIWDMYADTQFEAGGSAQGASYSTIGDGYNREHSMPKSWFSEGSSPSSKPGTDPHHLFATDGYVNNIRSNYPYGEVGTVSKDCYTLASVVGFGKLGTSTTSSIGTVFEPDDAYKGDLARAQMYMAAAYYNYSKGLAATSDAQKCFTFSSNVSTMKSYYINLLTKWSEEDPVSQKELDRNEVVYAKQGNRNPFIDHPGWANKIWGGTEYTWGKTTDPTVSSVTVSPKSANLYLDGTKTVQLSATVSVSGGAAQTVSWTSSNTNVATVSSSGLVTAKAAGNATITVKSTVDTSKSDTCSINVSNSTPVSYTVTFNANGHGTAPSSQTIVSGGLVTEPTAPTASGYTFGGWYKEAACTNAWNFSTDTVTATTILYAKWTEASSGGTYTFTAGTDTGSKTGATGDQGEDSITKDGITMSTTNGAFAASGQYRVYSGSTLSFTSTAGNITSIVFTATSSRPVSVFSTSTGSYTYDSSDNSGTWTGSASSISFSVSAQARFSPVEVTLEGGSASTKTLSSISLNTSGATTSFEVGDTFSSAGLVVTAHYSDASSVTVTPTSVSSPDMSSAGTKTVTVTYTDSYGTASATYEITVSSGGSTDTYTYKLVTGSLSAGDEVYIAINVSGQYYVLGKDQIDTYAYYLTSTAVTVSDNKITPTSDMTLWTVGVSSSKYTFSYDSKYLNSNVSSSGTKTYYNIYYANSSSYSGYQWTYSSNQLKSNQNVYLSHKIYNSTPEFTGTDTAPSYSIYFFRKTIQYTADSWAQLFLDNVSCNVSGTSEPTLNMTWSELSDAYDNVVSTTEKNLLKNASFTVTGSGSSTVVTPDSGTTQVVANAISKYEIIVRKYSYTNFIGRSGLSGQAFFLTDSESTSMVAAIVITSLVAISTIGGFVFLKKKKENY